MQYDRNDEIIYDENFKNITEKESYLPNNSNNSNEQKDVNSSSAVKNKTYPTVLVVQLVVCVLTALFFYCSKEYFSDYYTDIMNTVNYYINDSLIIEGNNLNDYFVNYD
jgi:hypothetical protein